MPSTQPEDIAGFAGTSLGPSTRRVRGGRSGAFGAGVGIGSISGWGGGGNSGGGGFSSGGGCDFGSVGPLVAGKERRMWQRLLTTFKQRWMDESDTRRVIAPDLA